MMTNINMNPIPTLVASSNRHTQNNQYYNQLQSNNSNITQINSTNSVNNQQQSNNNQSNANPRTVHFNNSVEQDIQSFNNRLRIMMSDISDNNLD